MPEEEIRKHRNRMLSLFKSWDDNPAQVGQKELRASIYPPGHPYHRRLQGYEETISKFGRYNLLDFHSNRFAKFSVLIPIYCIAGHGMEGDKDETE